MISFGDVRTAMVATVGINPSNKEFVDGSGKELVGSYRRLHTLKSLGLSRWSDAGPRELDQVLESCYSYFSLNPYDGWFRSLEQIIARASASYYESSLYACGARACHLDIIPYATICKWTDLSVQQKAQLLQLAGDALGLTIRGSALRALVLNGQTVVQTLEQVTGTVLQRTEQPEWALPRRSGVPVTGVAYMGHISEIHGVRLDRKVLVLGFNHNIQSSFGVTNQAKNAISEWVSRKLREVLDG